MTDFAPESGWAENESHPTPDFSASTRPAPLHGDAPSIVRRAYRPAAALAADLHELLESLARKRVPRLDAVRLKLLAARERLDLTGIVESIAQLKAAGDGLDFLAGRSGGERGAAFLAQGEAFTTAATRLAVLARVLGDQQALAAPVARLLWIELALESRSLRRRVRQGAHWLAQMAKDLQARRRHAGSTVSAYAIDELSRRRHAMDQRLRSVHRLCGDARQVQALCEQVATERAELAAAVQGRVLPACRTLEQELQLLLHAASYRPLVPEELIAAIDARHGLQVELARAGARLAGVRSTDTQLAALLAAMQAKSAALA